MALGKRITLFELPVREGPIADSDSFWLGSDRTLAGALAEYVNGKLSSTLQGLSSADDTASQRLDQAESRLAELPSLVGFGGVDDGASDNASALQAADASGRLIFIPKPAVGYHLEEPFNTAGAAWLADPTMSWQQLTTGGLFDLKRGHFTGGPNGANIWRFSDRVLIGEAAGKWAAVGGGVPDAGTSWLSDDTGGPAFLGVHAHLLVTTQKNTDSGGRYALVGAALTDADTSSGGIGVAGAVINRKLGSPGWAFYGDVTAISDGYSYGMELAVKNASNVNSIATPYGGPAGCYGIWLAAGGDNSYGPASTNPCNTAIIIGANSNTWNKALVVRANGLVGTDGSAGSATHATAIDLARHHDIVWTEPTSLGYGAKLRSGVTSSASRMSMDFLDNQLVVRGANETPIFSAQYVAAAANYLSAFSAAATAAPQLLAAGTDTNIDLRLKPKGTGVVRFGSLTSNADAPIAGYITIKDDGGTLRKLAVIA